MRKLQQTLLEIEGNKKYRISEAGTYKLVWDDFALGF
jgi:hypothetical protein